MSCRKYYSNLISDSVDTRIDEFNAISQNLRHTVTKSAIAKDKTTHQNQFTIKISFCSCILGDTTGSIHFEII